MAQRIVIRHVAVSDQMRGTASALFGYLETCATADARPGSVEVSGEMLDTPGCRRPRRTPLGVEPQHQPEPELGRTTLGRDQPQLLAAKHPLIDQLILVKPPHRAANYTRHHRYQAVALHVPDDTVLAGTWF
ncbi:hypothetical protein ACLMAL_28665 [Nocardia sp. CWNU-33]|uniref:hypothetical protein n=1 Tax=Nocardia sp. CWNU-33 TaxID=3392117 RepID=UPI00398F6A41